MFSASTYKYGLALSAVLLVMIWLSLMLTTSNATTSTYTLTPTVTPTMTGTQPHPSTQAFDASIYAEAERTLTAFPPSGVSTVLLNSIRYEGNLLEAQMTADRTHLLIRLTEGKVAIYALSNTSDKPLVPRFTLNHETNVDGMVLGANDSRLITWQNAAAGIPRMTVWTWDMATGERIHTITLRDDTRFFAKNGVRWRQDGTAFVVWTRAGVVEVWETLTNSRQFAIKVPNVVWGAAWNPAETRLMVWTTNAGVRFYDAADGRHLSTLEHRGATLNALWSADGRYVLSAGTDGLAILSDGETGAPLDIYYHGQYRPGRPEPALEIWSLAWSEQAGRVFSGSIGGHVRVWQTDLTAATLGNTQTSPATFLDAGGMVLALAANANGNRVFYRTSKQTALWDGRAAAPFFVSSKPGRPNPSMRLLAVWDMYSVTLHDIENNMPLAGFNHPIEELGIKGVVWLEDEVLLSYTEGGEARLFRLNFTPTSRSPLSATAIPNAPKARFGMAASIRKGDMPRAQLPLNPERIAGQTFVTLTDRISLVEVRVTARSQFGGNVRLSIKSMAGETLATQSRFVPPSFGGMLPFTFEPPIAVVARQTYRLEVEAIEGSALNVEFLPEGYPHGYAYHTQIARDNSQSISYEVLYDINFRVNLVSSTLEARKTQIAHIEANMPATRIAAAATATVIHEQALISQTATAAAQFSRAEKLGISPALLPYLRIGVGVSLSRTFELQPAQTLQFTVGAEQCCHFFDTVNIKAHWVLEALDGAPLDGVSLASETGLLHVAESVPHGAAYRVRAILADESVLSTTVHIYTPTDNPFVGMWQEEAQIACHDGSFIAPPQGIGELIFRANGEMLVTWSPFEIYFDYSAQYHYDITTGAFSFQARGINYLPADLDNAGAYAIDSEGRLILKNIWLGAPPNRSDAPTNCGHRFVRRGAAYR